MCQVRSLGTGDCFFPYPGTRTYGLRAEVTRTVQRSGRVDRLTVNVKGTSHFGTLQIVTLTKENAVKSCVKSVFRGTGKVVVVRVSMAEF